MQYCCYYQDIIVIIIIRRRHFLPQPVPFLHPLPGAVLPCYRCRTLITSNNPLRFIRAVNSGLLHIQD